MRNFLGDVFTPFLDSLQDVSYLSLSEAGMRALAASDQSW